MKLLYVDCLELSKEEGVKLDFGACDAVDGAE